MIPLSKYIRIKDRYCVAYFGAYDEYVMQLLQVRPLIEKELPGIQVYVACRDVVLPLIKHHERVLSYTQLKDTKAEFAHVRELRSSGDNPVLTLMVESNIPLER